MLCILDARFDGGVKVFPFLIVHPVAARSEYVVESDKCDILAVGQLRQLIHDEPPSTGPSHDWSVPREVASLRVEAPAEGLEEHLAVLFECKPITATAEHCVEKKKFDLISLQPIASSWPLQPSQALITSDVGGESDTILYDAAMDRDRASRLEALAARRWRLALALTAAMLATYFGFVLLVAYDKPLLGRLVAPGLSLGILLGAMVIVVAWVLTGIYVRWANVHYDAELAKLKAEAKEAGGS